MNEYFGLGKERVIGKEDREYQGEVAGRQLAVFEVIRDGISVVQSPVGVMRLGHPSASLFSCSTFIPFRGRFRGVVSG